MTEEFPSVPAKCHYCQTFIHQLSDHDPTKHPAHQPVTTQYQKTRMIKVVNYLRVNDDEVEYTTAFVQEDGNVVISAAWFNTLMSDGGWKRK